MVYGGGWPVNPAEVMPHETALIATIAVGIGAAFLLGLIATRLRLPPLVGYVVAGVLIGPFTPGFIADTALAQQLAEIGVILLMFGVGIHFSLDDLLAVRRIAIPGAVVQIAAATALGAVATQLWGWSWGAGVVFGLCLSVASTVVLVRAMESRGMLDSIDGRIAIGWLVVEDLATVLVLVLLPTLSGALGGAEPAAPDEPAWTAIALTLVKVMAFFGVMVIVGSRLVPWVLERVARMGSREMFTLAVLAVALGTAFGAAALFDVSFALGAFLAGVVVSGSELSHEAASDALPLQDAFSVLFFVAVGMLFDPEILYEQPFAVLTVVLIVVFGKSAAAFLIVIAFRFPVRTALTISASLAQIGEFSFILAALALSLGLFPETGQSLIVAGAIITIALNPLVFWASDRVVRWFHRHPALLDRLERGAAIPIVPPELKEGDLAGHAIVIGYGRVGAAIGEILLLRKFPFVAIDHSRERVLYLRERGRPVLFGDAARPGILELARPERARLLVIAAPDPYQARAIIARARAANPDIQVLARAHSDEERSYLEQRGASVALVGEHELAFSLAHHALLGMGCDDDSADETIEEVRRDRLGTVRGGA